MTLAVDEFIRRFLLHVLPKGFHRIRHYGLLSADDGAKGARLHDLAYLELADFDPFDLVPAGTSLETLVSIEGHRWALEDSFETAKNELGLDHNEARSWHGWHRHVSLVMLAFARMATIRYHAKAATLQKTPRRPQSRPCH